MQKKKRSNGKYYLAYSVIFILLAGIIYSVFLRNDKSFVYAKYGDGHGYFNFLVYYGRWLRQIIMSIIQEHRFCIPLWDMHIGYGSDLIITFGCMNFGDPLNLLAVFFSADNTEILYGFLAILRMWLAGLTFSIFGLYQNKSKISVLSGSIIYAFCGYALFIGIRDVFFMGAMYILPLIFVGVDKVFKGEKPYLFILMTALAAITNYYLFFMMSIWIFIYGVYRYFMLFGRNGFRFSKIAGWISKCIGYYLIGTAMAAAILLPTAIQLLKSERLSTQNNIPLFYSFDYYWKLLIRFTTSESMEAWAHLGFAPICVIAIFVLFLKKKKEYLPYKIAFLMCVLFLMTPFVGSLMNAGSYVVNRWVWAFSMLVAYIYVEVYPELFTIKKKEKLLIIIFSIVYAFLCLVRTEFRTTQMAVMMAILLISVLMLLVGDYLENYIFLWKYLLLGCIIVGVVANGIFRYAWFGSNYAAGFVDKGKAWAFIHDKLPSRELEAISDHTVVRYDSIGDLEPMYNTAMNHGLNSTNFYFSLADGTITRYFDDLNVNVEMEHRYKGVDERTILERLAGVKYCIAGKKSLAFMPYGYNKEIVSTDEYVIRENENALPVGYTYDSYMTNEEYEELSAVQKQQALMQCAVIETGAGNVGLAKAAPVYTDTELPFTMEGEDGIQILEDRIVVSDTNAVVRLQINAIENSEIYLVLTGIVYDNANSTDSEQSVITYIRDGSSKKQVLYSPEHAFYHGRDDYIINMGYTDKTEKMEITLQFEKTGVYHFDELSVTAQPMEQIEEQTKALAEESLESIVIGNNEIRGALNVSEEKLLCVAVPYSEGWSAWVDGTEVEVKCVNGVYNGFEVTSGEHEILMLYRTPGLRLGLFLGIAGVCCFIGVVIYWRKKS